MTAELKGIHAKTFQDLDVIKDVLKLDEEKIEDLEKENAELKEKLNFSTQYYQGEKAKEIIREFVEWANWQGNSKCPSFKSIQDKAEQFISEVENERCRDMG